MEEQSSCYTYFRIVGDFNPDLVTEILGLDPVKSWKIGDKRCNGTKYDFASWEFGRCEDNSPYIENQMRKTIAPLWEKVELLGRIRLENNVSFYLEIVPSICAENPNICLSPSLDIIDFCHATRTQIDIDLYIISSHED